MKQLFTFGANGDLIAEFVRQGVRFLVVGGLAVKFYAPEREADDLDILLEQTPENASRLFRAFGVLHLTPSFPEALIASPSDRQQQLPLKVVYYADIVTTGKDIDFDSEWARASEAMIWQSPVRIASRDLLTFMKHRAGREKDLADVALLERGG